MIPKSLYYCLFLCWPLLLTAQSGYQRMAIPQGKYDISPNLSRRITSYCLDENLKAPNDLVSYGSVIGGAKSASVTIYKPNETVSISLQQAIRNGSIEVSGNTLNGPEGNVFLRQHLGNAIAEALVSDHQSLIFHNRTPYPVRLSFESNIQMGAENSRAESWIEDYNLSSNLFMQDGIQKTIWESQKAAQEEQARLYAEQSRRDAKEAEKRLEIAEREAYNRRLYTLGYGQNLWKFQRANNLPAVPGLDQATKAKIHDVELEFAAKFVQIGIRGNTLSGQISAYQGLRKIKQTGILDANTKALLEKDHQAGVYFLDGKSYKVVSIKGKKFVESECNSNLLVPFDKLGAYEQLMEELARRKFLKEEIEILSFVLDYDTQAKLKSSFSGRYTEFFSSDMQTLKQKLKAKKRKSLFILGHIEKDMFVGRNARSEVVFSMRISDIKALAQELRINIFLLGCNSAFASSTPQTGIGNAFNSLYALNRLENAMHSSHDVCRLLGSLASDDLNIILDGNPFEDREYMTAKMAKRNRSKGAIAATGAVVAGAGIVMLLCSDQNGKDEKPKK